MYLPPTGRWLSEDPAGYVDGPNQYLYVGNNPANRADPSGMAPEPYPPGDRPGTFNVRLKECDSDTLQVHPGCCCTDVAVIYKPSQSDRGFYSRICVDVQVRTQIERHFCTDVDSGWHADLPKDKQSCWSFPAQKGDTSQNASWTDFPGGGPNEGTFGTSKPLCFCPQPCQWTRLQQAFQACAVGQTKTGGKRVIGCIYYGHVCNINYSVASIGTFHLCTVKCDSTRTGGWQDIAPSTPAF